jgi:hypothetical protein
VCTGFLAFAAAASADHTWGPYHWARTANPFTIQLGDNVGSAWDIYLRTASTDWSLSTVLDTVVVSGKGGFTCAAQTGRAEVCNKKYGKNGWLGLAQIWVSGEHITKGVVKMNDTYFNTTTYNKPAWRALVMCQEIGHIFGLDHQDENFSNTPLGTCMDYSSDPNPNQHPNAHDYEMLEEMYAHLDTTTTITQTSLTARVINNLELSDDPKTWGQEIRRSADGRASLFVKDLGQGQKIFRHVFWAEPRGDQAHK